MGGPPESRHLGGGGLAAAASALGSGPPAAPAAGQCLAARAWGDADHPAAAGVGLSLGDRFLLPDRPAALGLAGRRGEAALSQGGAAAGLPARSGVAGGGGRRSP